MTWTKVPKPTGSDWTMVNPQGREMYDDPNVMYDDPNVFYDGINQNAWTMVAKPTGNSSSIFGGMTMGLVMPLTTSILSITSDTSWTKVPKPI